MALELPDWFDIGALKATSSTLVIVAAVGAVAVIGFVRSIVHKLVAVVVLLAVGLGIFAYRARLDDCQETCDCKVPFFDGLVIDGCPNTN